MNDTPLNILEQKKFVSQDWQIVVATYLYNQDLAKDASLVEVRDSIIASNVLLSSIDGSFWGIATDASLVEVRDSIIASNVLLSSIDGGIIEVRDSMVSYIKSEDTPHVSWDKWIMMLAIRSDSDTPTANDGDYTALKLDEMGRLKVSTQPASYTDGIWSITANWQSISLNVDRASNITISMVATSLSWHNATFEYSNNSTNGVDGNWYVIQVVRSNANTVETATGVLAATPVYWWEASVNAYKWVRVRATAHTAGTAAYIIKQWTYATEPIPAIQVTGTQPISGSVTALPGTPATSVGYSTHYTIISAATTNDALIKAGATVIGSIQLSNTSTSWRYVKIYDKATAPVSTDTTLIKKIIALAPNSVREMEFATPTRMALGLWIRITANAALNDTAAVWAGDVIVNISYV
jgi:hypothetical protein